jgi:hypothetical protein
LTRERPGYYRFREPLLEIYIRRVGIRSAAEDDDEASEDAAGTVSASNNGQPS